MNGRKFCKCLFSRSYIFSQGGKLFINYFSNIQRYVFLQIKSFFLELLHCSWILQQQLHWTALAITGIDNHRNAGRIKLYLCQSGYKKARRYGRQQNKRTNENVILFIVKLKQMIFNYIVICKNVQNFTLFGHNF